MDDLTPFPPTQPSGALVPPPKVPGTAVAAAAPAPLPGQPRPARVPFMRRDAFAQFLERTLDAVDELADTVAAGLGLRQR
jgi:hypothetical protein